MSDSRDDGFYELFCQIEKERDDLRDGIQRMKEEYERILSSARNDFTDLRSQLQEAQDLANMRLKSLDVTNQYLNEARGQIKLVASHIANPRLDPETTLSMCRTLLQKWTTQLEGGNNNAG